jgi:outer membrane protein
MKKILLSISLLFVLCLSTSVLSAKENSSPNIKNFNEKTPLQSMNTDFAIGYIDVEKILASYPNYQDLQSNQKITLAEINQYTANAQKEINLAKTQEEKKQLTDKYSKEIQKKKETFNSQYAPQMEEMKNKIKLAIKNAAVKKKLSAVFKNDTLFFGGVDITNDVIYELNKI